LAPRLKLHDRPTAPHTVSFHFNSKHLQASDVKSFAAEKKCRSRPDVATSFRQVDIPIRTSSPS
jgi:hypothetical protein